LYNRQKTEYFGVMVKKNLEKNATFAENIIEQYHDNKSRKSGLKDKI